MAPDERYGGFSCSSANPSMLGEISITCALANCNGADHPGTEQACLDSAGTCADASPALPGTTTFERCNATVGEQQLPGGGYEERTPGTFASTAVYVPDGGALTADASGCAERAHVESGFSYSQSVDWLTAAYEVLANRH